MTSFSEIEKMSKRLDKYIKECEREKTRFDETIGLNENHRHHLANLITAAERLAITALGIQVAEKLDSDNLTRIDIESTMELPEECELKKTEFGFEIFLPLLNGKPLSLKRKSADGKLIRTILRALITRHSDIIERVDKPVIIFEYHINPEDDILKYTDPDNWNVKFVTDELQGFFIGDDNALNLTTMHIGVPDEKTYSKINIIPKNNFLEWGIRNVNLF